MAAYLTADVISNTNLAGNFYQLICRQDEPLQFIPGQYLIVKINPERVTQYSIASLPGTNEFELLVDITPDGVSSKYIKSLKPGDQITYLKPMGKFVLKELTPQIAFLATGSGIAPFKSMIPFLLDNYPEILIKLLFGLRHTTDIFYSDFFSDLTKQYSNFNCHCSISQPDSDWTGLTGHITKHLDLIGNFSNTSFYLCGSPNMIDETNELLLQSGVSDDKIYFEKYW